MVDVIQPAKVVPAIVEYVDVPGIRTLDEQRQSYPAQELAALRGTTMLALVVRQFDSAEIPHPAGSINPERDLSTAILEFIVSDLVTTEKRLEKLAKQHDEHSRREEKILERCLAALEKEQALRELEFAPEEEKLLRSFSFLSIKPLLIVLNMDDKSAPRAGEMLGELQAKASFSQEKVGWVAVAAGIEKEIAALENEDRELFLADLGFKLPALDRVVDATHDLLGMITFFTGYEKEVRAWSIPGGSTAVQAAAAVHEDLARGFIRAEVATWEEYVKYGSESKLREAGKLRLEGKSYIVRDGDLIHIRFNV